MNSDSITKQDLQQFEERLLASITNAVRGEIRGLEERFDEKLQELETRILKATYGYIQTVQTRLQDLGTHV